MSGQNFEVIAPGAPTAAIQATIYDATTSFINIQNTDATNPVTWGFTQASAEGTDGVIVPAGDTYPIPLNGGIGSIFLQGPAGSVSCRIVKG